MENLEETLKKYPLYCLNYIALCHQLFCGCKCRTTMTNIANPYTLWLAKGLYYVIGGILGYIVYKIGQIPYIPY